MNDKKNHYYYLSSFFIEQKKIKAIICLVRLWMIKNKKKEKHLIGFTWDMILHPNCKSSILKFLGGSLPAWFQCFSLLVLNCFGCPVCHQDVSLSLYCYLSLGLCEWQAARWLEIPHCFWASITSMAPLENYHSSVLLVVS